MSCILAAGTAAPEFTLRVTRDQNLTAIGSQRKASDTGILSRRREPGLWPDDAVQRILPEFRKHDAEMRGISVDGV
jgi:hypothetical protein